MRARVIERGDELMILKLPGFFFSPVEVGDLISKARKHKALIVDLRGNPGGSVETLKNFIGGVFDKDIKIGDRIERKDTKPSLPRAFAALSQASSSFLLTANPHRRRSFLHA